MGASMSLDVGVLDHCAPNLGLFPDECRGLGRSAPGGVQVDLGKVHAAGGTPAERSEEHTSELQSLTNLVCRLLLEKKKFSHIAPIVLCSTSCSYCAQHVWPGTAYPLPCLASSAAAVSSPGAGCISRRRLCHASSVS